jgi:polyhydroxyalkanoate synthase
MQMFSPGPLAEVVAEPDSEADVTAARASLTGQMAADAPAAATSAAAKIAATTAADLAASGATAATAAIAANTTLATWPLQLLQQGYQRALESGEQLAVAMAGPDPHHQALARFSLHQWGAMLSPSNFAATNPDVIARTFSERGANLLRGALALGVDLRAAWADKAGRTVHPADNNGFVPGQQVAVTPGKVVFSNRLIELLQYTPTSKRVYPEPLLIVPAWIMKYYILDLEATNSLIAYLVAQGHTVFCISWKNPSEAERDLDLNDYLTLGVLAALNAVQAILPDRRVHLAGYCLGGTLAAIAASALTRDGDTRLASLTLLAAQTDFSEPGELGVYIDEAQIALLEAQMAQTGYLSGPQMASAFAMLRPEALIYAPIVKRYLLGDETAPSALMAWNADATRMPARMHASYLRELYLNNALSRGQYQVDGRPVNLQALALPLFCVSTETDHVAPWPSVFKLHHLTRTELTFVLTSGGHNAGIVSEPGHPHRHYRIGTRPASAHGDAASPASWQTAHPPVEGSWWPAWSSWLSQRSGEQHRPPSTTSAAWRACPDAPGTYVLEK